MSFVAVLWKPCQKPLVCVVIPNLLFLAALICSQWIMTFCLQVMFIFFRDLLKFAKLFLHVSYCSSVTFFALWVLLSFVALLLLCLNSAPVLFWSGLTVCALLQINYPVAFGFIQEVNGLNEKLHQRPLWQSILSTVMSNLSNLGWNC